MCAGNHASRLRTALGEVEAINALCVRLIVVLCVAGAGAAAAAAHDVC
jgi:hypothetical protein